MRKTITYSSLLFVFFFVAVLFLTATSYSQLLFAIALYPFVAYSIIRSLPKRKIRQAKISIPLPQFGIKEKIEKNTSIINKLDNQNVEINDINKRAFLKLVGAAGLSFFIFSLLGRKTESLLFGKGAGNETLSIKDKEGNKINPAQSHPTDGYRINEIDDSIIAYYGFTNKEGAWFIIKEDTDNGSFRYSKGEEEFSNAWENRETLTYDYYNNVF